jgi:DNA-binding XRE family transcriptional regulator
LEEKGRTMKEQTDIPSGQHRSGSKESFTSAVETLTQWTATQEEMRREIGQVVRTIREHFGMTQVEFGEAIGVSSVHVSHIENGKAIPSAELLRVILNLTIT